MASPSAYNVFLSFRGEDTRHSFTDHLYEALKQAGISTFRDNDEIKRGEKLQPEIERAIKGSRASLVVFSQNYATSTWCLDELALILQQRRECNHFVLPVFYHVDPSDVRNQRNTFAIKVKASSRWTVNNVKLWTKALKQVADLAGMVLFGSETKFVKEIVDTIYNKLECKEVYLPPNITGMAARYTEISSWLNQPNAEFLVICGIGGSGKTTLAKYIYNLRLRAYENTSFVEGISGECEQPGGLRVLQKQLLKDILGGKKRKIPSVSQGTTKIAEALETNSSFIVLDDIVEKRQLIDLLGTGKIHAKSKIIITTRENTDNWFMSTNWRFQEYKMDLLNADESLELLSLHAFGSKVPMEGLEDLADQAVQYCEGNPLALEVLASSLSNSNTISHWKSQLNLLNNDLDKRIQDILIMSYNSLSFVTEKKLFLHIACFFVGKDMDYVVRILESDCSALSGIKSLSNKCLLSVSPYKKLMMHRLVQEMAKNIVRQESEFPAKRSRVWLSKESYKILTKGKGSETLKGLAIDMQQLADQSSTLTTDSLQKLDRLKLLQLKFVQFTGSYENFSRGLRWLCWIGFHLRTIPFDLSMGKLVALDMSYSKLEVFEPPTVLQSLQILNLTHSHDLLEIRNMSRIPHLETLILWNCCSLVRVCKTIEKLTSLTLLNMTGCNKLCKSEKTDLEASTSSGEVAERPTFSFPRSLQQLFFKNTFSFPRSFQRLFLKDTFSFPRSLQRLFLKDCNLNCTESFPDLSFSDHVSLQYLNLANGLFEFLPCYDHLKNLRILDLSLCSKLKRLLCLPSTLAELYVYYCKSLEEISFQSHRFTLQELGYEGCISLSEIEGFIRLVPVAKLEEDDLGHMKWLKEYQNHEVCLVGDDELTKGRSPCVQMLYEFNIMSTSLPDIKDRNMKPEYISDLSCLSFEVPSCPKNRRLKGLDVTFKYTISGDDDWVWFCKISTTNGVDLMYNPKVYGKPEFGEVGIWLSHWPIGNTLGTGDTVSVSIAVISGLEVHECGVSLVYTDDTKAKEDNMGWVEVLGGDLSGFQLSTRAYYLCRHDFYYLMEVGRLTPDWFSILVGDTIDCTEVRGWRKTGRPTQLKPSFTELKFVRCIIHGPESEEIYKIAQMSKSSSVDETLEFTSSVKGFLETEKSTASFEYSTSRDEEEIYKIAQKSKSSSVDETLEFTSSMKGFLGTEKSTASFEYSTTVNEITTPSKPVGSYLIPLEEILLATENFSDDTLIGVGRFGKVYKGKLSERWKNCTVAIKRRDKDVSNLEFYYDLDLILRFHHKNIIQFVGYNDEGGEKITVSKYASNHSLDNHLQDPDKRKCLTWAQRLKICLGAAKGLNYLHTGGQGKGHRDFKSAKILLDEDMEAKICDFGLYKLSPGNQAFTFISTEVVGTQFYMDPAYGETGFLCKESDIYSFGVVMFEVLCGMMAYQQRNLADGEPRLLLMKLVRRSYNAQPEKLVDPFIAEQIDKHCLRTFIEIAYNCISYSRKERPTMDIIIQRIEDAMKFQGLEV